MCLEECLTYSHHSVCVNCYYLPIIILEILYSQQERENRKKEVYPTELRQ